MKDKKGAYNHCFLVETIINYYATKLTGYKLFSINYLRFWKGSC